MNYELRIAARYLWSTRKRLHTAFLSIISTLGLAVGVATLLISLALLSGLQNRIKGRLLAASPHLLIEPLGSHAIEDSETAIREAEAVGTRVEPYVAGMVWTSNRSTEIGRPARMRTLSRKGPDDAEVLTGAGLPDNTRSAYLTRSLAAALRVDENHEIVVEFLAKNGIKLNKNPNAKITKDAYALLQNEFQQDKEIKKVAEEITKEKFRKENIVIEATQPDEKKEPAMDEAKDTLAEELPLFAVACSGPEGCPFRVLVTYPRAPERMTSMTSSAASDTDSARKVVSTPAPRTPLITAGAFPPGRWTSRRTTSGVVRTMTSIAPSTSSASPTTST